MDVVSKQIAEPEHVQLARMIPLADLLPSPENDDLYVPFDPDTPQGQALISSMKKGWRTDEPAVVSADFRIISGHRRTSAARYAGLREAPAIVLPVRWDETPEDEWKRLLAKYNVHQRQKTRSERLKENLASLDPEDAHRRLRDKRQYDTDEMPAAMAIGTRKVRHGFDKCNLAIVEAVRITVERLLKTVGKPSLRQVHYLIAGSDPPVLFGRKQQPYTNIQKHYASLSNIVTRMRLNGIIPIDSIIDETRPILEWDAHLDVQDFIDRELDQLFRDYWRDLQQSQPAWIELLVEKKTLRGVLSRVAGNFTIPLTMGGGYASLPPRHAMAERFRRSGRDSLTLLIVSDLDPDGEVIAESFARSMRDDFGIENIHASKIAVTPEQVKAYRLPAILPAKSSSSNYDKYVRQHGEHVWEVEALEPSILQQIVRDAICGAMDVEAYNAEVEAEKEHARFLEGARRIVRETLREVDLTGDDDDA